MGLLSDISKYKGNPNLRHNTLRIRSASGRWRVPNRIIVKDMKSTYNCYVRCATLIVWVGWIPRPQTSTAQYHAQLGLPDKGRAMKGMVVCHVVWLESRIYWMGLWTSARCVICNGQDGYRAQVPQHPIDSYRYIHTYMIVY